MTRDPGTATEYNPLGRARSARRGSKISHARKWPRLRHRYKVLVKGIPAFTVDLSGGGFSTELLRVLPPGAEIEGNICIKGRDFPFTGRVVWATAGAPYAGRRGRIGVLFTQVAPEVRELGNSGTVIGLFRVPAVSWVITVGERSLTGS